MILCAGAVYGFGSIAQEMRKHLHMSAYQQGLLALCGNVGLWIGSFTGGIVADFRGPRVAMLGGATFFLVGYGGIWLVLRSGITTSAGQHVAYLVSALWLSAGLGSGWVYNATIFTNSANFGLAARPKVIGLLATLFGASSTIWSTLLNGCVGGHSHRSWPPPAASYAHALAADLPVADDVVEEELLPAADDGSAAGGGASTGTFTCVGGWVNGGLESYFFLLAVALPSLTVLGALSSFRITDASERRRADRADGEHNIARRLNASSVGVLLVLIAVGLSSVLSVVTDGGATAVSVRMIAPIVVVLLFGMLVIGIAMLGLRQQVASDALSSPSAPLLAGDQQGSRAAGQSFPDVVSDQSAQDSKDALHTPRSALSSVEFWLMWLVMTTVCGSNASTMNIMSLIFTDRHAGSDNVSRIASILVMVISSLSRFLCGLLIAASPLRPTPVVLVSGAAMMATLSQSLFALDSEVLLFGACVAMGISDGMFWGSLPVVSNRVFGLRNSGGIYGMLVCLGAVGFIALSLGVQPEVYAHHSQDRVCHEGVLCFRDYHITCACFAVVGGVSSLGLLWTIARRKQVQEQRSKLNDGLL